MAEAVTATVSTQGTPQDVPPAVMRMFTKVITSDRIIKNQQRGDPDLTGAEKIKILTDILRRKPGNFLMRFGSLLDELDLTYFEGSSDHEVSFRVRELFKNLGPKAKQKRVRNRRYECLKKLTETSDYFTEEVMRDRNPMLYEYYIGQYLTEEEREDLDRDKSEMSLSALIMKKMDIDRRSALLHWQWERESGQKEETNSSSEEEEEMGIKEKGVENIKLSSDPEEAEQEKRMMRQEFLRAMQLSFLGGEDRDFDYSEVDWNEQYDSMDLQQQDEEEAYFDAEEPFWYGDGDGDEMEYDTTGMGTGQGEEVEYDEFDAGNCDTESQCR